MTNIDKGVITWSGVGVVGGGVSVFYAYPGGSFMTYLRTFFNTLAGTIPSAVTLSFPSTGDTIDDATGHLVGSWSGTTLAPVTGTAGGAFADGVGTCFNWLTTTICPVGPNSKTAHRIKGRTYLVPLGANCYDATGHIPGSTVGLFQTAANTLVADGADHFAIWHRPLKGGTDGLSGKVMSAKVDARVDILTSRRD